MEDRRELPAARTWFTADTHIGQADVASYFGRDRYFPTLAHHDRRIRAELKARIEPGDTLVHLGDVGAKGARSLCGVPGVRQILVRGNHDDHVRARGEWDEVVDYVEFEIGGQLVLCLHYPMLAWRGDRKGSIHLHGHSHGRVKDERRGRGGRIDVGVDCWSYKPVRFSQIVQRLAGLHDSHAVRADSPAR